jgi:hypothetical protein
MKWQNSARLRSLVPVCSHLAKTDPSTNTQALTLTILIGWTSYVISLSQAGKLSPLDALGDALKGVGKGDSALISGQRGLGVFKSIVGGAYLLTLSRNWTRADEPASAAYTITFGVLGFIPAPSVRRKD